MKKPLALAASARCLTAAGCSGGSSTEAATTVTFADDDRIQVGYLGANIKGEGTVTCKIGHEGQVVAESTQTGNYAYANCPIERDLD